MSYLVAYLGGGVLAVVVTTAIHYYPNSFWGKQIGCTPFLRGDLPVGGTICIVLSVFLNNLTIFFAGAGMFIGASLMAVIFVIWTTLHQ